MGLDVTSGLWCSVPNFGSLIVCTALKYFQISGFVAWPWVSVSVYSAWLAICFSVMGLSCTFLYYCKVELFSALLHSSSFFQFLFSPL